ncbi:ATP-binding cassette domain-containing protein [Myroides ceti]|uniref:ATP-binding cassette domain-containing protein n=1 Tax=Paenimyroides ceti TaxID=395087 RepID=A0ABT8D0N1_9FLAO|nr:ATP-binding cassette domain-containing protein [Paenimyroides ceti]
MGNNGAGKSTLLKIIAGTLEIAEGVRKIHTDPYYVPQVFGQFNELTVAEALHIDKKLKSLHEILNGNVTEEYLTILNDDWTLEDRCREALEYWKLQDIELQQKMETLSGGQKNKVFLAGMMIHEPELALLDEPSNHLDTEGRAFAQSQYKKVYAYDVYQKDWAMVKNGSGGYGFIDRSGKEVVPSVYRKIEKFGVYHKDQALVRNISGGYGFIDRSGKEVVPAIYELKEIKARFKKLEE